MNLFKVAFEKKGKKLPQVVFLRTDSESNEDFDCSLAFIKKQEGVQVSSIELISIVSPLHKFASDNVATGICTSGAKFQFVHGAHTLVPSECERYLKRGGKIDGNVKFVQFGALAQYIIAKRRATLLESILTDNIDPMALKEFYAHF